MERSRFPGALSAAAFPGFKSAIFLLEYEGESRVGCMFPFRNVSGFASGFREPNDEVPVEIDRVRGVVASCDAPKLEREEVQYVGELALSEGDSRSSGGVEYSSKHFALIFRESLSELERVVMWVLKGDP